MEKRLNDLADDLLPIKKQIRFVSRLKSYQHTPDVNRRTLDEWAGVLQEVRTSLIGLALAAGPDKEPVSDSVEHPSHYTRGSIECLDYIWSLGDGPDYARGCIIKYLHRYKHKGGLEDLKKAHQYLAEWIRREEALPTIDEMQGILSSKEQCNEGMLG